jgi:hypothetical protein
VRFAVGEIIVAKIEESVGLADVEIRQTFGRVRLNVAVDVVEFFQRREHRFVTQGAAAEQTANVLLLWREASAHLFN